MTRRSLQRGCMLVTMILATSLGALPQRRPAVQRPGARRPPVASRQPQRLARRMLDLPPRWADRLRGMMPAEQEKFLNNNARFRNLPAERRAQIRRRLKVWNELTPEQRHTVMQRQRVWQQMTPRQQLRVRETLLPAWRNLRPARRQLLLRKLHGLRDLADSERTDKLNDESFLIDLGSDDRRMLRELSNLRISEEEPGELRFAPRQP